MNPKKLFPNKTISCVIATALAIAASGQIARAVPYSSAITNNSGTISFILNENADNVKVIFDNGSSTNDLGALTKGSQSFNLDVHTNYQIIVTKASGPGYRTGPGNGGAATVLQISTDTNALLNLFVPKGVAVNKNPKSPYFGRIYMANDTAGTTLEHASRTTAAGIFILNADQSDAVGQGDTALTGGLTFGSTSDNSPYHIRVGEDDNLYITDWSDTSGNLYRVDPNGSSGILALKALSAPGAAVVPVGAANNHGSVAGCYVSGSTATGNLKIYTIDEDLQSNKTTATKNQLNSLWVYNVNGGALPYTADPTRLWTAASGEGINSSSQTMDMDRAPDGKFFITTLRSAGNESGLIVRDSAGTATLFNSKTMSASLGSTTDYLKNSSSVAVSRDGKWVIVQTGSTTTSTDNKTWIMPLTNGIPDLSKRNVLNTFAKLSSRQVAIDAAGNVYVTNNGEESMRIYSPGGTTIATYSNDTTGTNGAFSVVTIEPTIFAQPQSLTNNAGTTANFAVSVAGSGTLTYQWQFNGTNLSGATGSSLARANVQQANAGSYQVIITNVAISGTTVLTSSVVSLTVIDTAPIITVQPTGATNAAGTSKTFNVTTTGKDPRTYQWQSNGTNIAGATATAYTRSNAQTNDSGTFNVIISNSMGSITSSIVDLLITNSAPVLATQPKSQVVAAGSNVTFTASISAGTIPVSYQWSYFGTPISGATNTSYVLNNAQPENFGDYTVSASNPIGDVTSTNATLTITNTLPVLLVQPRSQTNGAGSNLVFTVTSLGNDPRTIQWQFEGFDILDATNSTLAITNLQAANAGTYTVTIINDFGGVISTNAVLTITNRAPIITAAPTSVSTNAGSTVNFTVNANGQTNLTYQWSRAGNNIPTGTDSTLTLNNVQLADAGFYTVVVGSGAGTFFTTNSAAQLALTLASTPGTGTGLRGDYYTVQAQTFTNAPTLTRIDTNVDFVFGTGTPDPSISVNNFTVRWTGQVQPLYNQDYTFFTRSDDGARLWVNGKLLVNRWVGQAVTEVASTPITLTAGQKYDLLMEYFEGTSTAEVHLLWSSPSQLKTAIPMTQLYPASTGSAVTPALNSSFNGSSAVFDWTGTFILQTSINVDGPYTNLTTLITGPFTNTLTSDPQRYFRLKAN